MSYMKYTNASTIWKRNVLTVAVLSIVRTKVLYYNPTYSSYVTLTAKKYNRTNKLRFVTIKFDLLVPVDNTFMFDFYLYELLSNVYKRSFVEFHIGACDIFLKDNLVSSMVKEAYFRMPAELRPMKKFVCPLPPGNYSFLDMKLNLFVLPATFPFQEGRAYVNFTRRGQPIGSGYLDFIIKLLK
ncbi:unnamed protein product [Euphydryas editha]|uniref:Uncharacterized protein n=1 Tax=Euphydryas editha TaxID=104508 RepID=A0AAU9U729_EUPED|nr:unnamed protein product [Euphydryas editha]